jgi:uncharacterized protein with von Willebrand factor type A (vWA) domain
VTRHRTATEPQAALRARPPWLHGAPADDLGSLTRVLAVLQGLLDFLQLALNAATGFDGPLRRTLGRIREADLAAADVLIVTDGLGRASPEIAASVDAARQGRGLRVWAVLLGQADPAPLAAFADRLWRLRGEGPAERQVPGLLRLL